MIKKLAYMIWRGAEYFNINLGRLAPTIFGLMIGRKGVKIK